LILLRIFLLVTLCVHFVACASTALQPRMQVGHAPISGGSIYFETAGRGQPVIFLHGFTLDCRMWDDQFTEFARHYQTLLYDARGFGRSTPISAPYSAAEDLCGLMDRLGIQAAHLVGLSMGGRYAIDFTLQHPERVKSLVLVDSVLGGHAIPATARAIIQAAEVAKAGDLDAAKRLWLDHDLFKPASEQPHVADRLARMVADYNGWHFLNGLGAQEELPAVPAAVRLKEIEKPTLVVVGSREVEELLNLSEMLSREIQNARLSVIPGVGHMSNMEAPAEFNAVVLEFLAGL
jgi:3-oxoadipate enol-lactonase